jgi:hypothetical protein
MKLREFKIGDKVKMKEKFSDIVWYSKDIFTITKITNEVDIVNFKIVETDHIWNEDDYFKTQRISTYYLTPATKENRKLKLQKLNENRQNNTKK